MNDSPDALWRYMKLSTFLLLLEGKAWFPSVASLRRSDPLEAALGDEFYEKLWRELECKDGSEKAIAWLSTIRDWEDGHPFESGSSIFAQVYGKCVADDIATRRAAWCWFKSEHESAAMWPIYGHQGVAVMTHMERLRASLPQKKNLGLKVLNMWIGAHVWKEASATSSQYNLIGFFNPISSKRLSFNMSKRFA